MKRKTIVLPIKLQEAEYKGKEDIYLNGHIVKGVGFKYTDLPVTLEKGELVMSKKQELNKVKFGIVLYLGFLEFHLTLSQRQNSQELQQPHHKKNIGQIEKPCRVLPYSQEQQ